MSVCVTAISRHSSTALRQAAQPSVCAPAAIGPVSAAAANRAAAAMIVRFMIVVWTPPGTQGPMLVRRSSRLQFCIRPLVRGFVPAGPDGICRSAPHFSCGLDALHDHAGLADRGLTCLPSHLVVPCATFQRPSPLLLAGGNTPPPAAPRRPGSRSSLGTHGHGPARPRSCVPSCWPVRRRRRSSAVARPDAQPIRAVLCCC